MLLEKDAVRLELLFSEKVKDSLGNVREKYKQSGKLFSANVQPQSGSYELFEFGYVLKDRINVFTVPDSDIETGMALRVDGSVYKITGIWKWRSHWMLSAEKEDCHV